MFNLLDENKLCEYCNPEKFKEFKQRKEFHILSVLKNNGFEKGLKHNCVPETKCGKERPDFYWEFEAYVLICEVDESQHKSYSCLCEQIRMINISQSFGGKPVFWIRYNPDAFRLPSGELAYITQRQREEHLLEWIRYGHTSPPTEYVQVIHLFYDECELRVGANQIQTLQKWEREEETKTNL